MRSDARVLTVFEYFRPSSLWLELPLLIGFNLLLVGCAYLSFDVPFSPVPITGQTFGVLLVAMALGRVRGTGVVLAYVAEGASGLPVFAGGAGGPAVLIGPTGGYLVGFVAAAYLVGWLAECGWDRGLIRSSLAMVAGNVVIFACGLAQLTLFVPAGAVLALGLYPFVVGGIIKTVAAAVVLPAVWKTIR